MVITQVSRQAPWLLLLFSLPTKRASQRVGVWRQLQHFGALPLRNSGYLLPNHPANRERFEWLAASIRHQQGAASVVEVQAIDNLSRAQLVERFNQARDCDYQALLAELRKRIPAATAGRRSTPLGRLRRRFQEIAAMDFFGSPLRRRVEGLLERAEATRAPASGEGEASLVERRKYQGRLWVTRPRPGIDRSASAWLIRRAIDRQARFAFAAEGRTPRGAVPFDMYHGGFGHRGDDCTFQTLLKDFRIRDRRLARIGEIVHDADLCDEKFGHREGFGLDEVLQGWARQGVSDNKLLERGMGLVEGLYHSLR
jgi:hypothetical protein